MLESLVSLPEAETLEVLPAAAVVLDADGILVALNHRATTLLGRPPGRGDPFRRYCTFRGQASHPSDGRESPCPLDRCLQTGEPLEDEEAVIHRAAGLPLPIRVSVQPVRGGDGRMVGAVGLLRPSDGPTDNSSDEVPGEAPTSPAEERFRALIEQGHDGISLIDTQGTLLYTSPSVTRLLGYTQEEVLGTNALDLVHPEDRPEAARALRELAQTPGGSAATRARLRHHDGTWRHFSINGTNRLNEASVAAIILNYSDLTSSYLAERALEEASALLRQVTESLDDVCWVLDTEEQRIIYVSPAYERVWGWPAADLYRTRDAWLRTVHPDDREHALQDTNEEDPRQGVVRSYRIVKPDGTVRWIRDRSRPLLDESGRVYRMVGIAEDVTEQLAAQRALRESEARKRATLDAALDAVVTADEQGRILEFNPSAERAFGHDAARALGRKVTSLIAPGAPRASFRTAMTAALCRAGDPGGPTVLEVVALRADGSEFPIEVSLVPIPLAGQGMVTLFIRDLSQPRRMQEELRYVLRHARCLLRHFTVERRDGRNRWTSHDHDETSAQEWLPLELEPGCDYSETFTHRKVDGDAERNERQAIEAMEADLPFYTQEFRVRDLHGEDRWFSETISLHRRGEGLWDAIGVCVETTELKQGEERLRQQVLQQTTLTELARQAAEGVELDLLLQQAAELVADLTQVQLTSVFALEPGQSTFRFVAGKGWPEEFGVWAQCERLGSDSAAGLAVRTGEPVVVPDLRTEWRFSRRRHLWSEGIVSYLQVAIQGSEGPWGALGCFSREPRRFSPEDIRFLQGVADVLSGAIQRDHAMALLRRSELRMEHLSSSSVIGVLEVTLDGRILAANKAFLDMLGLAESGPGSPLPSWVALTPEDYRAADESALRQIRATQVCGPLEKEFLHQDGHRVPVVVSAAMLAEDNLAIALVMDLSPQRQLRDQLHQAQKMEALGRLAGGVAHDFNNLLTVVNGYSDLLLRQLPPRDPARGKIEAIGQAGERAAALTRQLLAFSRRQVVTPQRLDLRTTIGGFDRILRRLIGEDVELSTLLCSDPLPILADPTQIEQILLNLCVNARDAMPDGGRLSISADRRCLSHEDLRAHPDRQPGDYGLLTVADTGVGMTPEVMGRIFEPFFTTRGESGSGTGLGLSTVYGIVEQLNGFVSVMSAPGQGACFSVYLPLSAPNPDSQEDANRERLAPGGTETILLAEDDEMVRSFTRDLLASWGYSVLEAGNGEEALRLASQHEGPLHLLLSDLVMPRMGGRELVEQMATLRPETRILLVSGYTDDQVVRRGVWAHQLPFLQKPWAPADLARKIREVLGNSEEQT